MLLILLYILHLFDFIHVFLNTIKINSPPAHLINPAALGHFADFNPPSPRMDFQAKP